MDASLGFAHLLGIAQGNQKDSTTNNVRMLKTKFGGAKKEGREKGKLSAGVQKFLEQKAQDEKKKKIEEKLKLAQLNELRTDRAKNKIAKHLKVTKSANKAVLSDALDRNDTSVTLTGRKQCDEDDYGYTSKASAGIYEKLMSKYEADPEDPMAKFSRAKPKEWKDLASAKDRVKEALRKEEENPEIPGKRRRKRREDREVESQSSNDASSSSSKWKNNSRDSRDTIADIEREEEKKKKSSKEREKEEARRKRLQQNAKKAPPTMDFQALLKIANQKKDVPIKVDKGPRLKDSEFGDRPMTQTEKAEFMRENKAKLRREGKLPASPPRRRESTPPSWDTPASKKMSKSSSPVPSSKSKIPRNEPGPQFHSAVKRSMPPPSERKREGVSEMERERREIEAKMRELEKKKDDMERKHKEMERSEKERKQRLMMEQTEKERKNKVMKQNEERRMEYDRREEERKRKEIKDKRGQRESEMQKKELGDMQAKYKEMQRKMEEMENKMNGSSSSRGPRNPSSVESRAFPGEKKKKSTKNWNCDRGATDYKRRIESDSEEEYDSEMDDFIDDANDKTDISAEIRNIFGYDKRRYKDEDFDDRSMENNKFSSIMMEEARSAKIGRQEDLEDMRREEMERKKKKFRR